MQASAEVSVVLGLLSGLEVVALLSVILVLFGCRWLADLRHGLGQGFRFRNRIDRMGEEAGQSVGNNYAKPVYEAITEENGTVEFHDRRELGRVEFRFWKRAMGWLGKVWVWMKGTMGRR